MASVGLQPEISPRAHYLKWFKETLTNVHQIQEQKFPVETVREIAKDFSILVSPPLQTHSFLYSLAVEEGILDEVNKACAYFQQFRKALPPEDSLRKTLEWFSFEPLTEKPWTQELHAFPLVMSDQKFKIVKTPEKLQAYWKHLMTCLCPAASPRGIDRLAVSMAVDLRKEETVALIDFGAGGCLPVLPIVSRLTHMKQINLYLVDPIYRPDSHRMYRVMKHSISESQGRKPLCDTQTDLAIMELMGNCAPHFPQGCTLYVHVLSSVDQLIKEKLGRMPPTMPHVLFGVDPEPTAAKDFQQVVGFLATRKASYYCLNELAGVNGKLTQEEALNTDRIFSRIPHLP